MISVDNTFSINNNLFRDSNNRYKICNKERVFREIARYFRKTYGYCRCCQSCMYCFAFHFAIELVVFHRIIFFPENIMWKVYLNTNCVDFELLWLEQF